MYNNPEFAVAIVTLAIAVGTMIWRMAILHQRSLTNKESIIRAHQRIDDLENTQTNKIDTLSSEVRTMREAQIRMEEKLNLALKMGEEKK